MSGLSARLGDILLAIERLELVVTRTPFDQYKSNFENQWLVERGVEIVSEASRHIPSELTDKYPQIEWRDIRSIGNRLRHEYERIDLLIMWTIATKHLAVLKPIVLEMLAKIEPPPNS